MSLANSIISTISNWSRHLLLPAFLLIHLALSVYFIQQQELTFDEPGYADYSKRWMKGQTEKVYELDDSKTPLTFIAWVPRIAKQVSDSNYKATDWGKQDLLNGRYMFLLYFYGIVLYVYLWSRKLYGLQGFWLPLLLLLLEPLMMIYGLLINSDIISGFLMIGTMYHFYRFHNSPGWLHLFLTAVITGLSLATKQGFIFLPLIFSLIYAVRIAAGKTFFKRFHLVQAAGFLTLTWIILNTIFFFQGSLAILSDYHFYSGTFKNLQTNLSWYRLPLLVPSAFIQGVDLLQYHAETGPGIETNPFAGVYINGTYSTDGVWFYYLLAALIKFPLGFILITLTALVVLMIKFRTAAFVEKYQYLLVPIVVYGFIISFLNPFQIGIRHLLIIMPLIFVGLGYMQLAGFKGSRLLLVCCLLWNLASIGRVYPDIIPYTNELITKKAVHEFIYDTSIDYGQADEDYKAFIYKNPGVRFAPVHPEAGKFIVPARYVMNIWDTKFNQYNWLRKYKPIGTYKTIYLLYHIK